MSSTPTAQVTVQAFNDSDAPAELNEHERLVFEFDRSIAAFDGDAIVGTTAAYSFQLTVPGGITGRGRRHLRQRPAQPPAARHPVGDDAPPARRHRRPGRGRRGAVRVRDGHLRTVRLRLRVVAAAPDDPPRRGAAPTDRQHGSERRGGRRGTGHGPVRLRAAPPAELRDRAGQGLRRGGPAPARDGGQGRTLVAEHPRRPGVPAPGDERAEMPAGGRRRGPARLRPVPDEAGLGRRRPARTAACRSASSSPPTPRPRRRCGPTCSPGT